MITVLYFEYLCSLLHDQTESCLKHSNSLLTVSSLSFYVINPQEDELYNTIQKLVTTIVHLNMNISYSNKFSLLPAQHILCN